MNYNSQAKCLAVYFLDNIERITLPTGATTWLHG